MKPRFAIVNTWDAPRRRLVAEWIDGVGYCYMARAIEPHLKAFDGMNPERPTPIEDFGFDVFVGESEVLFRRARPSSATYEDGRPRRWHDLRFDSEFTLPRVQSVKITPAAKRRQKIALPLAQSPISKGIR